MCDTMVCLPCVTANGAMIFGKNSDRSPNEPHIIERIPPTDHDLVKTPLLKATYIEIDQVPHTYGVTLMKPSWIWGAEMGFNEHGVNIGNEAVFTKVRRGGDSLIGMDLLRLGLERAKTALEALYVITGLLEKYGQGGNCGYQKKFYYDNSFLIADRTEAYVLETAGKYWAAVKVKDIYAISNGLTIDKFDFAHPEVMKAAESNPEYSFRKQFTEPVFTYFAQSKGRRLCAETMLNNLKGKITVEGVMNVLRSHTMERNRASVGSVCMHAGGLIGDHTTGAYVGEIKADGEMYYATGASLPCMSVFKPLLTKKVPGDMTDRGIKYWYDREMLSRYFLSGQADLDSFVIKRDKYEKNMLNQLEKAKGKESEKTIEALTDKEQALIDEYLSPLKGVKHEFRLGKAGYRKFWKKKTEKLIDDLKNI
ncbi:MAG: C69 family dipeptidase [Christensenellales bacterium]